MSTINFDGRRGRAYIIPNFCIYNILMKKIMFCGGGSAGHVTPNLALCEELKGKVNLVYVGTDGIEKQLCDKAGIHFIGFNAVKLVRGKVLCNLKIPFSLMKSVSACKRILQDEKPDLLFCKGGYVSLPPAIAARKLGIPVLTHESDISPGLANRLIAGRCERVLTTFPQTAKKFSNGIFCGSPMRPSIKYNNAAECKRRLGLDMRPAILVLGGGSGSKKINDCLRECLAAICRQYNVIHLCGRGNAMPCDYDGYRQIEFCDDMGTVYGAADYAVARCGSNSANELISLRIPTLFIPLANSASRGDQIENAEYFRSLGLCRVLDEKQLTADRLKSEIEFLIKDEKLKTALGNYIPACGNKNILREIQRIIIR